MFNVSKYLPVVGAWIFIAVTSSANGEEVQDENDRVSDEIVACPQFLNYDSRLLHSRQNINLCEIAAGKTLLLVNTASHCGYTKHFKSLEAIHQQYKDKGLVVVGFPSNDFFQEDEEEAKSADICFVNYGVTFTMLAPSEVRGKGANPVFQFLADASVSPKWNFYKYLVNQNGTEVHAFSPLTAPDDDEFIEQLEAMLATHRHKVN